MLESRDNFGRYVYITDRREFVITQRQKISDGKISTPGSKKFLSKFYSFYDGGEICWKLYDDNTIPSGLQSEVGVS
jgi:hypothetical protein